MSPRAYNMHMKFGKYKDLWYYLGGGLIALLLIVLFVVVPSFSGTPESTLPTDTTNKTESNRAKSQDDQNSEKQLDQHSEQESATEQTPPASSAESINDSESAASGDADSTSQAPASQTPTHPSATTTCHHEEAGRCWDDLEDEAYSAGAYDHEYGYYGASLDYADDCDTLCRDILEDAYDEGWHDR